MNSDPKSSTSSPSSIVQHRQRTPFETIRNFATILFVGMGVSAMGFIIHNADRGTFPAPMTDPEAGPDLVDQRPSADASPSEPRVDLEPEDLSHAPVTLSIAPVVDFPAWATRDPRSAASWLAENATEFSHVDEHRALAESFARIDPLAARTWFNTLPVPMQDVVVSDLAAGWAARAPREAMNAAASFDEFQRLPFQLAVLSQWTGEDVNGAKQWVESLPQNTDETLTRSAHAELAYALAKVDSATALQWAESRRDPQNRAAAVANAISGWSETSPAEALSWALDHRDSSPDMESVARIEMGAWAERSPNEAGTWLDAQADSPLKDVLVESHALSLSVHGEPAAAAAWATTIRDPAQRARVLGDLYLEWNAIEPEAAGQWLSAAPLSAAEKDALQQPDQAALQTNANNQSWAR